MSRVRGEVSDAVRIRELVARDDGAGATAGRALLRDEVYLRIRSWIITGDLLPETRLRDGDVADALGVSRMPVREAIRRLEDEGFVETAANRWTKVAALDPDRAGDLYPIIWSLERLALNLAGEWSPAALAGLRSANDRLAAALASHDAVGASDADTAFHQQIVDASGNPDLVAVIDQLKVRLRRVEIAYFDGRAAGEQSVAEHAQVIAALETGDQNAAGAALEQNWRASLERLCERLPRR